MMLNENDTEATLIAIKKLTKDVKLAAKKLGKHEVRFLVDLYYQMQHLRITTANQVRTLTNNKEPNALLNHFLEQFTTLENAIRNALLAYVQSTVVGRWLISLVGIGPVISSGLIAHIDIEKAPTVGNLWRFAGMDPTVVWEKGKKRPWNQKLKKLAYFSGESFIKFRNHKDDFYGKLYAERKHLEEEKNEAGLFLETAQKILESGLFKKDTDAKMAYEAGRLPQAQIHARARRYAAKIFLSHVHQVMYEDHYKVPAPKPYAIDILGHVHIILPPNWISPKLAPKSKIKIKKYMPLEVKQEPKKVKPKAKKTTLIKSKKNISEPLVKKSLKKAPTISKVKSTKKILNKNK